MGFHSDENSRAVRFIETHAEWWLPGAGGEGNRESVFNGDRVSVWKDGKVLETDGGNGCPAM